MSLGDPAFWLGALFTTLATACGVFLAFTLERTLDRRSQAAAAFWLARHWGQATVRMHENGPGITVARAITCGRTAPRSPAVQMALAEIDPRVAAWWSTATEYLIEAGDSVLPGSVTSKRRPAPRHSRSIASSSTRLVGGQPGRVDSIACSAPYQTIPSSHMPHPELPAEPIVLRSHAVSRRAEG